MYPSLPDMLLADGVLARLTADCQALVEQELSTKSGVSATAVKVAYKAVRAFAPGYYQATVEKMVPAFLVRLQPFWADFREAGGGVFGDYLAKRDDEVTEAMLKVTDDMASFSERPSVVKAYKTVRGGAGKHVRAALPAVGELVERYAA